MITLTNDELKNINGGAMKTGIAVGIIAGVTFLIGILDGIFRPLRCN